MFPESLQYVAQRRLFGGAGSLAQTRLWLHFASNRELYKEFGDLWALLHDQSPVFTNDFSHFRMLPKLWNREYLGFIRELDPDLPDRFLSSRGGAGYHVKKTNISLGRLSLKRSQFST